MSGETELIDRLLINRRQFQTRAGAFAAATLFLRPTLAATDVGFVELDRKNLPAHFDHLQLEFCALDLEDDTLTALNGDDIDQRHAPWSSFKIPNLIIALETGAARDLDHLRAWDAMRRPAEPHWPNTWQRNHTMRTAFQQSVPWYFQEIASEVGADHYRSSLTRFGYGNVDVPDGSDSFWLGDKLQISPREQMRFVQQVVSGALRLSTPIREALRKVSLIKTTAGYALHGKTGSGPRQSDDIGGPFEGWLVGWIERQRKPGATFALYVSGPGYRSIRTARLEIAELLLMAAGHLPPTWR